jgi:hypothetical protein
MNLSIRRKLAMAASVRDFVRARPADNPGVTAAAARLDDRVARAEVLAQQEVAGRKTVSGAAVTREQLRREIRDTIALLVGLARPAAREEPELAAGIVRPRANVSNQSFLTGARVAAATSVGHRALLQRYGMPDTFPEDLGKMLDRFETTLNEQHSGRAAHVGARAELDAVTAEIMQLVQQLDALNRFRFKNDAEALGAWRSARNVAWPLNGRGEGPAEAGAVKPAA